MKDESLVEAAAEPQPLYEYTIRAGDSQRSTVYYLSTGPEAPPSFQRGKQLGFAVFKPGEGPGTAPVFLYTRPMSDQARTLVYAYTRSSTPPPGFGSGSLVFFAFAEEEEGTVPVYEYCGFADDSAKTQLYYYSSHEDAPPGWVLRGIAFWAPAAQATNLNTSPFLGRCGVPEGAYCVSMSGRLEVNSQVTIGGSKDLSECIRSKPPPLGGEPPRVFSIRLIENQNYWIYRYSLYIDAQGGGLLGLYNLVLCFEDETDDFYTLEIVSSTRKTYVKNYNSEKPNITRIKWMMLSEFVNPCPMWKEAP